MGYDIPADHHGSLPRQDSTPRHLPKDFIAVSKSLKQIHDINIARANRWHPGGIEEWSALEWAGAMTGEAGEAANAAKKLKRLDTAIPSINDGERHYRDHQAAHVAVAKEVADTIIYGLLLMARVGVEDPEAVIREVFNKKSIEYGFPERL